MHCACGATCARYPQGTQVDPIVVINDMLIEVAASDPEALLVDDGGVNLTWLDALKQIVDTNFVAAGLPAPGVAVGAAGGAITFHNGDPTVLEVNLSPARCQKIFLSIKQLLGPHSRIERINFNGGTLQL